MRKTAFLVAFTLFLSAARAQAPQDSIRITDTTEFLSIRALNTAINELKDKITVSQYEQFMQIMNFIIATTSKEWEEKQNKKKP